MPTVKDIPFQGEDSGFDELAGPAPYFTNALVDNANVIRARPGITVWSDFPAAPPSTRPVTMITSFGDKLIYTTDDGQLFAWTGAGTVIALSAGGGDSLLDIRGDVRPMRPVAVAKGSAIFVAIAGGVPQKLSPGLVSESLGGGAPEGSAVVYIARRLVISGANGLFYWSGILDADVEFWDTGIEFREAEASPDDLVTLSAASRYLCAFGTDSVEVYAPDENATFAPVAALEVGCGAARSVFRYYGQHAWLDDKRQFILSSCQSFTENDVISDDIQTQLENLTTTDDCWGFRMALSQHDCLTFVFPTEGRVFAFDVASKTWSQWYGWTAGRLGPWAPTAVYFWRARNMYLVGLANGTIAQLSFSAYTDLGAPIYWRARTGFVDHGVSQPKAPLQAHLQFRRGQATSDESAVNITWRDDLGGFAPALRQSLGTAGDVEPTIEVTPCGAPYRQRQWEVSSTAEDAIAMVSARETFDLLEGVG
jgi:hypothetical protein